MKTAATNKSATPDIEFGVYKVEVVKVEDAEGGSTQYNSGPRRVITYKLLELVNEDGSPFTLRQWYTFYNPMRKKSAMYGIFSALMYQGEEIPEGADLDDDELVGKRGELVWGLVEDKDKQKKPGISGILPPKMAGARAGVKRVQVTEEDINNI